MKNLYGKAMKLTILAAGLFVAVRAMAGSLGPMPLTTVARCHWVVIPID